MIQHARKLAATVAIVGGIAAPVTSQVTAPAPCEAQVRLYEDGTYSGTTVLAHGRQVASSWTVTPASAAGLHGTVLHTTFPVQYNGDTCTLTVNQSR